MAEEIAAIHSSVVNTEETTPAVQEEEQEENSDWWGSVGSVWNSFKETAGKVVEIYKEDLQEFTNSVVSDTEKVVEDVKSSDIIQQARSVANDNLNQIVDVIASNTMEKSSVSPIMSRLETKISELQQDIGTYCTEPMDEGFAEYCKEFSIGSKESEIISHLATFPTLQKNFDKFVPNVVEYEQFWKRYFYRENKVKEREEERQALIKKASVVAFEQADLSWDDEENEDEIEVLNDVQKEKEKEKEPAKDNEIENDSLLLDGWDDNVDAVNLNEKAEEKEIEIENNKNEEEEEDWAGWE